MLISGDLSTNKTDFLINAYTNLLNSGVKSSEILVLVQNSNLKQNFINKTFEKLKIDSIEKLQVHSFFSLVYNTINDNWVFLENINPFENPTILPNLAGLEVSQFLLKDILKEIPFKGYNSKKSLLHQIFRRYSLIVQNNLTDEEVEWRSRILGESFSEDANAAAWAEHVIGSSKGMPYSVMLTLGTGVGGGIILDNKLYKGKNGAAGEMHFKMRTDKHRKCTCGSYDCFEAYASGTGLKRTAEEISGDPDITTYDVIENKDRPMMKKILETWQNDILEGIIGLANIFDPDVVVLSGSMAEFVDIEYLEKQANKEIVTTPFKVVKASAGNYSGMIGAALLALGVK